MPKKPAPAVKQAPDKKAAVKKGIARATVEPVARSDFKHNKLATINGEYTDDSAITWVAAGNPRAPGKATYDRFNAYFGSATVGEYKAHGGTQGDLNWDLRSGVLNIAGVKLGEDRVVTPRGAAAPTPAPRGRKAAAAVPEPTAPTRRGRKEPVADPED